MRQLYALLGRANFTESMKNYFTKFSYKNAKLQDLLDIMQAVLDKNSPSGSEGSFDLNQFRKDWIETAGCNEVTCDWDSSDKSENAKLTLLQYACLEEHPLLRYHKMNVGFYSSEGELLETKSIILKNVRETVIEYNGSMNVAAIVPNVDDLTFIKIALDQTSLAWARKSISNVKDDLTRSLLWRCLFEMVRDVRMKSTDFIDLVCEHAPMESASMLSNLFPYLSGCLFNYTPEAKFTEMSDKAFKMAHTLFKDSTDPELRHLVQDLVVSYSESSEAKKILANWLEGTVEEFKESTPTLNQKWSIVYKIHGCDQFDNEYRAKVKARLDEEDQTDLKKKYGEMIRALVACDAGREELSTEIYNKDTKYSYVEIGNLISGLNSRMISYDRREKFHQRYFDSLIDQLNSRNRETGKVTFFCLNFLEYVPWVNA